MQIIEAGVAVARIESSIENEALRIKVLHPCVLLGGVETLAIEIRQISRLADRDIVAAVDEQITVHGLGVVRAELLRRPAILRRTEALVIIIKAVDKLRAMPVELIGRTAVPQMNMRVDYEYFLAISGSKHLGPSITESDIPL